MSTPPSTFALSRGFPGRAGKITDPTTGERVEVELFVAVMGASNFTYAEVTAPQQSADWIASHVRLLTNLGGVSRAFVPDQQKSGVVTASRFEPTIQRTYEEWSQHCTTTIREDGAVDAHPVPDFAHRLASVKRWPPVTRRLPTGGENRNKAKGPRTVILIDVDRSSSRAHAEATSSTLADP